MADYCEDAATTLVLKQPLPFGDKDITFRLLTLNVCCTLASLAVGFSVFHIMQHAMHYFRPFEQKHIVRILAVIPVYAWTTFLSYVFYNAAAYCELIRECYAAYATASFFTLMCHYIAPNLHEQKEYFRDADPKNWGWPLNWFQKLTGGEHKGWLRKPRSGVTWFNARNCSARVSQTIADFLQINFIGIFQYVVLRTIVTVISVVTQSFGRLCKGNANPRYASTWTAMFDALSVLVAMYCMHQVYHQLKEDLAPNKPILKMVCVKLIVFLTYWQTWLISLLIRFRVLHKTPLMSFADIHVGIPCLLTCAETLVFAILHYWAFPWRQYDIDRLPKFPEQVYECGPNEALLEAASPWDYCCATARGFRWLFHGVQFRNASLSYEPRYEAEGNRIRNGTQSDPIHKVPKGLVNHFERKERKTA
ncbi:hypothetical protein G6011_06272 [Alternaria panax]|uniref:DUF300-domain-containing protein n=1 Tax=Alternaria panax TaxID=48097 RepID=A0AAD4I9P9_9PLEO|nr:hypothetical protein G6011_06272 [Alternaria panax]